MQSATWTATLPAPVWYQQAYFLAHLEEEIDRCVAANRNSFLIHLSLNACSRSAARRLVDCTREELSANDFAGMLASGDYAICLADTSLLRAAGLARRLDSYLADFDPSIGLAGLVIDGLTSAEVLESAPVRKPTGYATALAA
jgi:hypothetical protein